MKFIDFFSGAGMFRKGMEQAGHECIGYVEIDKQARETYEANYDTKDEWVKFDVTQIDANEIPESDIWCFGFPCKNMSTANAVTRTGLDGEQSGLFLTMCNLLDNINIKPKYLFIENVQGFTTINGGLDFLKALCTLSNLSYNICYEISSAMKYDVPQNRIRTYMVCELNNTYKKIYGGVEIPNKSNFYVDGIDIFKLYDYINNEGKKIKLNYGFSGEVENGICTVNNRQKEKYKLFTLLKDILESNVNEKYYLTDEQLEKVKYMKGAKERILPDGRIWKEGAVPFPDSIDKNARCVTPSDGSLNRSTHVIYDGKGYRKLTIRERARLQGLSEDFVFPVSESKASLQLGNGVVVKAITEIAKREINNNIKLKGE
jgi:DNA-cytosine methyltransferase